MVNKNIKDIISKISKKDIIFTKHAKERSLDRDITKETILYYILKPELITKIKHGRGGSFLLHYNMSRVYELVIVVRFQNKKLRIITEYKNILKPKRKIF